MIHAETLAYEIIGYKKYATELQLKYVELKFKAAMYKAQAFHMWDLADKLMNQIDLNYRAISNGGFNGFCYCYDPTAEYLDFRDMYEKGILNEKEYNFCKNI